MELKDELYISFYGYIALRTPACAIIQPMRLGNKVKHLPSLIKKV